MTHSAESYGVKTYDKVTIESGTVTATGGTAEATGENSAYSYGVEAGDVTISGGEATATGGAATGTNNAYSYGVESYGAVSISSGTVEAAGGEARGDSAESYGISSYGLTITGGTVTAVGELAVDEGEGGDAYSYGVESYGDVVIENATVYARGSQANYSAGIYTNGIIVESGSVDALGGRAVNQDNPDAAASAGIIAGIVTINGGEVTASVGLTEHGTADGICAYSDININGGTVTATGASYTLGGVAPQYSGGLFSEFGNVTITGENTVVNANGGCADNGITAVAAKRGNIVIEDGSIRADGAYGGYTGYDGFGNGLSALRDDGGAGGNIIISGGNLAVTGYTDSLYYEGELIVRPGSARISVSVLDGWILDEDTWDMDWDEMAASASQIEGSPFGEETVIARALTEGKLYFGATDSAANPGDPTDPDQPIGPADPTGPSGSTDPIDSDEQNGNGDKGKDNPLTSDGSNMVLLLSLLLASGTVVAAVTVYGRRPKREQ
mgnify:FL=1